MPKKKKEYTESHKIDKLYGFSNDSSCDLINVVKDQQSREFERLVPLFICTYDNIRDFKMWYGEAVVRRQIVKITSGDVMKRVPLRLSRRSLAFYYGKVPGFTYCSLREYKPAVYFSF